MELTLTSVTWFRRAPRLLTSLLVLALGLGTAPVASAQNSGIFDDYVILNNTNYKTNATNPPASTYTGLNGAALGSFDRNTGVLNLNGGLINTYERNGDQVAGPAYIYYRVYQGTAPAGGRAFQRLALPQSSSYPDVNAGTFNRVYTTSAAAINLVSLTPAPGSYTLEIYLQVSASYNGGTFTLYDSNSSANYKATFAVTGTPQAVTTWTGALNSNWFDPANWTNGMPTPTNDAIVPDLGSGTNNYPNIYSNGVSTSATAPAENYNNTGSGPAQCKTLTLGGTSQLARSICRLITGTLQVYGDFYNVQDSFIQREFTTLEFAGGNQTISGGTTFYTVVISGSGTKSLTGIMPVSTELHFNAGILTTNPSAPTTSYVELGNRSVFNNNNGAQITGETDASYLRGLLRTTRNNVRANEVDANGNPDPRTFGNMGMTLLFTTNDPGDVEVTRNTSGNYNPLNNAYSIKRVFGVRPSNPQTNNGGLRANMIFRYLDSETQNLTPQGGFIPEQNLLLFVSSNAGNSFTNLGRTSINTTTNELTRNGVSTFATFTLGDQNAPLPVSLVAFDAKRAGTDAVLTWRTATETNSKGFEVQASADGREFRALDFVASQAANSVKPLDYRYVDRATNQATVRYYRLRQVDLDGKESYSPVRAVNFEGQAGLAAAAEAYPTPFTADLHLRFGSVAAGAGQLRLTDLTGRVVYEQALSLSAGPNEVALDQLANLRAGIYVARLALPSGGSASVKVQKL